MKTYRSVYIKKNSLAPGTAAMLESDIHAYNVLLRSMVCDLGKPLATDDPSIHVQYKRYGFSDYLVSSMERTAQGMRKSAAECLDLNIKTKEGCIRQTGAKIAKLNLQIQNMQKVKDLLVARSRGRKAGLAHLPNFVNYWGSGICHTAAADGSLSFTVSHPNSKHRRPPLLFENEYLFELLYVDPYIKKRRRRIKQIEGRIHNLKTQLEKLKRDKEEANYHICFGGKKLLRQRSTASDILAWRNTFDRRRTREMVLMGRKDATKGNFMVRYDTKSHALVYNSISGAGIVLPGVIFPYGQENVDMAVNSSAIIVQNKKLPPEQQIPHWERGPVTWSIKDCGNAFLVKCMISVPQSKDMNTCFDSGCIAFDMNYAHLAVAELNQYGQLLRHFVVPFPVTGRTSNQVTNAISNALEVVLRYASSVNKPVAMEQIKALKKVMYGDGFRNRKISQFAYDKMEMLAEGKAQKYALAVKSVNPAYTSQIGKLKYMRKLGLSIHEAAACTIGRRAMGFKERVPANMRHLIPRNKANKHHWAQWAAISASLRSIPICKFYTSIDYTGYMTMTALKKALTA